MVGLGLIVAGTLLHPQVFMISVATIVAGTLALGVVAGIVKFVVSQRLKGEQVGNGWARTGLALVVVLLVAGAAVLLTWAWVAERAVPMPPRANIEFAQQASSEGAALQLAQVLYASAPDWRTELKAASQQDGDEELTRMRQALTFVLPAPDAVISETIELIASSDGISVTTVEAWPAELVGHVIHAQSYQVEYWTPDSAVVCAGAVGVVQGNWSVDRLWVPPHTIRDGVEKHWTGGTAYVISVRVHEAETPVDRDLFVVAALLFAEGEGQPPVTPH